MNNANIISDDKESNINRKLNKLKKINSDDIDSIQSLIDQHGAINELIKKIDKHKINAKDIIKQLRSCNRIGRAVAYNLDSHVTESYGMMKDILRNG